MAIKRLANMGEKFDSVDRMTGTTPIMEIVKQVLDCMWGWWAVSA